jgi:surface antigen
MGFNDGLDFINESEYTAELLPPSENPEPGDLLVEDTGDDIGHVSLIEKVHEDGKVTVYEQNYNGDAETDPHGVEKRTRKTAFDDQWGSVRGYLRIED